MIRAVTFDKQLMRSEDFAHQVNYFYQGKMGVSKGCEVSTDTNGNIVVSDGYFSIYGRLLRNVGDTVVEVPTIPSGELYSILVFEVDLSKENSIDEFRQGEFKIVSSTSGYPSLTQQNLDDGGTIYQLEFCRFVNTVAGITNFTDTRTILSLEMYTLQSEFESHITNYNNEISKKANKQQGAWYSATLVKGWSGSLRYSKNDMGIVTVELSVTAGQIAGFTGIANIAAGYRPSVHVAIPVVNRVTGEVVSLYLSPSGVLSVPGTTPENLIEGERYDGMTQYYFEG